MTLYVKRPPVGGAGGPLELSSFAGADSPTDAPKIVPSQEDFLLEAIKALSAQEICADEFKKIPLAVTASGWRATACLLAHAVSCLEAGDLLNAELNRRRAREQFIAANDLFRLFQEESRKAGIVAEAFR